MKVELENSLVHLQSVLNQLPLIASYFLDIFLYKSNTCFFHAEI